MKTKKWRKIEGDSWNTALLLSCDEDNNYYPMIDNI